LIIEQHDFTTYAWAERIDSPQTGRLRKYRLGFTVRCVKHKQHAHQVFDDCFGILRGFKMLPTRKKLLVVDDSVSIRLTLSMILSEAGYDVCQAFDGFSALIEMRDHLPDVLLSDLNMPGMSGFELLSIVRRRFPSIRVIAMSSAFSGNEVPAGVAADAFYAKGSGGADRLLRLTRAIVQGALSSQRQLPVPIWVTRTRLKSCNNNQVVVTCPECLRAFPESKANCELSEIETRCLHCSSTVRFSFVHAA
jgi:CheY-like chemotaxis protein